MRDLTKLKSHPTSEKIVNILTRKTQNNERMFFEILVTYHLCKLTAMMGVKVLTKERGEIPVNAYAINLASSGQGKGHSTNIIEDQITNQFRTVFFEDTYPEVVEESLNKLAVKRAVINDEEEDTELERVKKEFADLGQLAFSFDSATTPAVKQMRHKLLMARIGSMNLEMDEMGSNLLGNSDVLGTFLELFDVGKVKQKLTKNTKESVRNAEIEGRTPANLLLFGTPAKLFDGSKIEDEFWSFIQTGYGRRCFFGYTRNSSKVSDMTAEEIYDALTDKSTNQYLKDLSNDLGKLAHITNHNKVIIVSKDVSIELIKYKMHCERLAKAMGEHDEMRKAEMEHRYFKAVKLAGAYAFIDNKASIDEDTLYNAIHMVEKSGIAFSKILKRDKNYVKLAKYIASIGREVTHVDLNEDLPFYKGATAHKADMMQMAIAWGYRNQVLIKKNTINGIDFIIGETLKKVNLDKITISYSKSIAEGYKPKYAPFNKLHRMTQLDHHHWINHHTKKGKRDDDHMIKGFDIIVLDVDSGVSMDTAKLLLQDYKYLIYTTKRHTSGHNRFRIIIPLNYRLELDADEYKEFMLNVFEWLPFPVDVATGQRSRKWLTYNGAYEYGKGEEQLDALLFIPKTSKNEERKKHMMDTASLSNMERWFITNSGTGNRNNQLIRYALLLVDMGQTSDLIRTGVLDLNKKLDNSLSEREIDSTIMVSVGRAISKRGSV